MCFWPFPSYDNVATVPTHADGMVRSWAMNSRTEKKMLAVDTSVEVGTKATDSRGLQTEQKMGKTVDEIKAVGKKNICKERILGAIDFGYGQEIFERSKKCESSRSIAEKLAQDLLEDIENDDGPVSAELLFEVCLHTYQETWLELSALSPSPIYVQDGLLMEGLGKFYLWGKSFQDGTLDSALEQSDEVREEVLKLICGIGKILTRSTLFVHVRFWQYPCLLVALELTSCRVELFPMVVTPSRRKKLDGLVSYLTILSERANAIISASTSDTDSDSDDTEQEGNKPDSRRTVEARLGKDIKLLTDGLMDLLPTLEQSLPRIGKLARTPPPTPPPAFRVSEPAFTYARNVYDKYPTADIELIERLGEANWLRHVKIRKRIYEVANDDSADDSALGTSTSTHFDSHASFISSHADGKERSARIPPTPKEVCAGQPFQCGICGQTIHGTRNRVDWKYVGGRTLCIFLN